MAKGRRPKPRHLKVLEGNPGKRPLKDEPRPTPKVPRAPGWLSKEARAEWRRVVPELGRLGLLTVVDRAALVAYCEAWALHKIAVEDVQTNGLTITIERPRFHRGEQVGVETLYIHNPATRVMKEAAATLRALATEFGLTPFSRSRLTMPELPDEEAEAILVGGARHGPGPG